MKKCELCGEMFTKRDRDSASQWEGRRYCSSSCSNKANASMRTVEIEERFWGFLKNRKQGCWEWEGGTDNHGYGTISAGRGKSPIKAHRLSWEIHYGPIPKGLEVCHSCDNPLCVNPKHLMIGSHQANMMDAFKKKRINNYVHGLGESNNSSTLTDEDVKNIRKEFAEGATCDELEIKYKNSNISRIVRNLVYIDNDFEPINGNKKKRKGRLKLTKSNVDFILNSKIPSREIGRMLGVSKTTVLVARRGEYQI